MKKFILSLITLPIIVFGAFAFSGCDFGLAKAYTYTETTYEYAVELNADGKVSKTETITEREQITYEYLMRTKNLTYAEAKAYTLTEEEQTKVDAQITSIMSAKDSPWFGTVSFASNGTFKFFIETYDAGKNEGEQKFFCGEYTKTKNSVTLVLDNQANVSVPLYIEQTLTRKGRTLTRDEQNYDDATKDFSGYVLTETSKEFPKVYALHHNYQAK